DEIVHAIDAAKAIVLVLSQNAADSQHVLREVERAASKRHPVISLRVDQAPLPAGLEYFLNTSHWLDASGADVGLSMPKLIAAVRAAIQAPVLTPKAGPTPRVPAPSPPARPPKRTAIVVASLMGLAIAGFAVDRLWVSSRKAVATSERTAAVPATPAPAASTFPEKSVAVLPFVDMSEKKDHEYFSDGMAEELIDMLTKIPDLRVPARTSSFYFKGKQATIADIAKALSVLYVLEGSVRTSGKTLRVTAQLIRADNGYHIWSETYDRHLDNVFEMQDEIAGAVVKALKMSLLGSTPKSPTTQNAEAYTLYLQARYFADRSWDLDNQRKAVELMQQAVRLDPGFARAWALLAARYTKEVLDGTRSSVEGRHLALLAAEKADAIDPGLPETQIAKAKISYYLDWDWAAADAEIKKARKRDPANAQAIFWEANVADVLGHSEDALRLRQQAIALDPLSPPEYFWLGRTYLKLGRPADAEANFRKSLDLNPNGPYLHWNIALALLLRGEHAAALAEMQRETVAATRLMGFALIYHAMGRGAESDAALREMENVAASELNPFWFAAVHAYRGEIDQAFSWLNRAYQAHDFYLIDMKGFPLLKNLEPDSRYRAFLRKMNLPE
ncbi:MAG TPA: tetratricopeptide repeat protein, partial [Steroidobacteraceae bacterium]|nr:tetratricopeptide repeat protein [Steroidobacteraceae bacterium]